VVNHLLHPSALPKAAELVRQELARQAIRPGTSRHDDPEAQLEALDLRRRRLLATYLDGVLDEKLFRTELGRLDLARVHIEEEWSQRKGRGAEDLGSWCLRQTAAFARLMTAAPSLADRRLLLSSLGARVILKTGGPLTLEVHLAFREPV
jgi:hypothetical protein